MSFSDRLKEVTAGLADEVDAKEAAFVQEIAGLKQQLAQQAADLEQQTAGLKQQLAQQAAALEQQTAGLKQQVESLNQEVALLRKENAPLKLGAPAPKPAEQSKVSVQNGITKKWKNAARKARVAKAKRDAVMQKFAGMQEVSGMQKVQVTDMRAGKLVDFKCAAFIGSCLWREIRTWMKLLER